MGAPHKELVHKARHGVQASTIGEHLLQNPFGTVHSTTKSFVPSTTNARMTDRKWELAMGVG